MRKVFSHYSSRILSPFTGLIGLAICAGLFPIGFFPLEANVVPTQNTPILLIHGYMFNQGGWLYFRHRLEKAGLGPVFTMNLGSPLHCIEEYSKKVKAKADEIARITGRSDLILIGHSMGGIVSTYYAVHDAPPNTVTDVITLGSPLQGTYSAKIGIGTCAKQMRCENEFLTQLHSDVSELENTRFFCLASKSDWIIIPQESALYSHPNAKTLVIPDMGHLQYLFSGRVINAIIDHLKNR